MSRREASRFAPGAARNLVLSYLRGDVTLGGLERCLVPQFWDAEDEPIAWFAELMLAEFTNGHQTEGDIRRRLAEFVGVDPRGRCSGTSAQTVYVDWDDLTRATEAARGTPGETR